MEAFEASCDSSIYIPGKRVIFDGLVSRSDLNGAIAVILPPSSEKESAKLSQQGRIKVTGTSLTKEGNVRG